MLSEMHSPSHRTMTLFDRFIKKSNFDSAWKSLHKNPASQGIDGVTIKAFQDDLVRNISDVRRALKNDTFLFTPPKGRLIPKDLKDTSKKRTLKIPAVSDRLVQRAIRNVVDKYFQKFNYSCSYGYIPRRSREDAISKIIWLRDRGYSYVWEADIEGFFDNVNQDILKTKIFNILPDATLNVLIEQGLNTEIGNKEHFSQEEIMKYFSDGSVGISQGGILSPLYANLFLADFDRMMMDQKFWLVRYADDFVVLCKTQADASRAQNIAKDFLEKQLSLKLHPTKTRIRHFSQGFDFLGFSFNHKSICPNDKVRQRFVEKITLITDSKKTDNLVDVALRLRNTVKGWGNAYSFCHSENIRVNPKDVNMVKIFESLDRQLGDKFFKLLEKNEIGPAGKRWGKFHLMKFGIPQVMEFLSKKSLKDVRKRRKLRKSSSPRIAPVSFRV